MGPTSQHKLTDEGLVRALGRWDATLLTVGAVIFILASLLLLANTLVEKPVESVIGLILIAAGLPAYAWWRRHPTPDSGEQT